MQNPEDQIILIDKPAGISSFGVVAKVRGYMKAKYGKKIKVGHTGTLDPFATGLLIILTGKMTKKSDEFLKKDKVYKATLKLGYISTTGDPEGEITEVIFSKPGEAFPQEKPSDSSQSLIGRQIQPYLSEGAFRSAAARELAPSAHGDGPDGRGPKRDMVEFAISKFIGKIQQTPPKFSAIKINGERAYKLARKGKDFKTPSREIEIYSIEIISYQYPELTIRCHVSSGTYIRTLAEDIGKSLSTGAYLTSLRREKIADYSVDHAKKLSDFTA